MVLPLWTNFKSQSTRHRKFDDQPHFLLAILLQPHFFQCRLTEQQKIALKYVRELEQPIPKEEVSFTNS